MPSVDTPSPTDPNSTAGNYSGGMASRMAGPAESEEGTGVDSTSAASRPDPQQALSNAVQVARKADEDMMALSTQFPQASPEIRKAREAIRAVLKKIVANPGGSEPPAPRTGV